MAETSPALFIYPLVLGVVFGGQQVLLASGAGKIFPLAALAGILGICRLAAGLGMAAGPVMTGYFHDMTGGYALAIIILGLVSLGHFRNFFVAVKSASPNPSIIKAVGSI